MQLLERRIPWKLPKTPFIIIYIFVLFLIFGFCYVQTFVCGLCGFLPVDCADTLLVNVRILGTLLASLVAGASRPQGSPRKLVTTLSRYRFPRSPTL